jgi:hypothetical protein
MKRTIAAVFALLCIALPLSAQTSAKADTEGSDDYFGGLHKKGSQLISLTTGAELPLFILPADSTATSAYPLGVGASFSLNYEYFVANHWALGGSLCGAFNTTVGGRTLFMAPIALKMGYWWGSAPMEYTVGMDIGANIMRLSGDGVITPFAKAGGGAFVQMNQSWSLGAQVYWWLVPELHFGSYASLDRYGHFLEISIGALYHF